MWGIRGEHELVLVTSECGDPVWDYHIILEVDICPSLSDYMSVIPVAHVLGKFSRTVNHSYV